MRRPQVTRSAAKKVLQDAGKTLPINVTVAYRKTATRDAAFAAMKQTWDQAGFNVTLEGSAATAYYRTIGERRLQESRRGLSQLGRRLAIGLDGPPGAVRQPS